MFVARPNFPHWRRGRRDVRSQGGTQHYRQSGNHEPVPEQVSFDVSHCDTLFKVVLFRWFFSKLKLLSSIDATHGVRQLPAGTR